jgi:hypothetical protein
MKSFWEKVDRSPDCWQWTAGRDLDGYGVFHVAGHARGAHRVAYELMVGAIPSGLQIDHLCRNRGCVNPDHLEPVTPRENQRRADVALGIRSAATHCPRGHEYSPENTYMAKTKRNCRACRHAASVRYQARKKARS